MGVSTLNHLTREGKGPFAPPPQLLRKQVAEELFAEELFALCRENELYLQESKKIIFTSTASHLASLYDRGLGQLGNGLRAI